MTALTASRYELAMRCIGSTVLPWKDAPSPHTQAGIDRHAADEQAIAAGDIPDAYEQRWPGYQWRAEVAFGLDIATGDAREVGQGIGRAYPVPRGPYERFGTTDAMARSEDGSHLVIIDKKGFEAVTASARNPQLRFLARAAATVYRPARVTVAIAHELYPMDVTDLDAFELDTIPLELRKIEGDVAVARSAARDGHGPAFAIGRWCRWCPAFNACPEQRKLSALVRRPDDDPELSMVTMAIDDDDAPALYQLYKRIGILKKRIEETLYAIASRRPIPVGNGKMFGRHVKQGNEQLDGDVVYAVGKELYGQEFADAAVIRSATKARLKEAAKSAGLKVAPVERAVLTAVRERGGSRRKETTEIGEFTPELRLIESTVSEPALPEPAIDTSREITATSPF